MLERLKRFLLMQDQGSASRDVGDDETGAAYMPKEKLLVFSFSLMLALCLWFIVNLNRDFSIVIDLPIDIRNLSEEQALVSDPPATARVAITGEGWKLIGLYTNPPRLFLDVERPEVNLTERVQRQISVLSDVVVTQVSPATLNLEMEAREERDVTVVTRVEIQYRDRFGPIGEATISPERVTISGAASRVREIDTVYTRPVTIEDVKESRELMLELESPATEIKLISDHVRYGLEVAEFTEAEVSVPIRIRNMPPGQAVTYNPTRLLVRYDVPIDQYNESLHTRPFSAWLDFEAIREDTTGQVIPEIERNEDHFHIRLRGFQPRRVAYFMVLQNDSE